MKFTQIYLRLPVFDKSLKWVFQVCFRRFPVGRDSLEVKKIIKVKFLWITAATAERFYDSVSVFLEKRPRDVCCGTLSEIVVCTLSEWDYLNNTQTTSLHSAWLYDILGVRYAYSFSPGLSSPLSLAKLFFLHTCSTEVKSRPYLEDSGETHPGVIQHDFNV